MEPTRYVRVSGGPAERGYQHGKALDTAIARFYDRWMSEAAKQTDPIHERDWLAYALSHLPETRVAAPDLVEEIEGIATGAGLTFDKVWFLNCFDEAGNYRKYRSDNALGHHCTTFAATGHSTVDGTTYIGQNWDISDWYDSVVLEVDPGDKEPGGLYYTHPGIVGGCGINSAGIGLVWNSLHASDNRTGVPCTVLVRKILQARNLTEAITNAISPVRAIGFNFIIAADYAAVNVEATATRHVLRYVARHHGHANNYDEPAQVAYEASPNRTAGSMLRSGRMNQLLDQQAGHIDVAACKRLLSDHGNFPIGICLHTEVEKGRCSQSQAGLIYMPAERRMLMSSGPPCENPFEEYRVGAPTAATVAG